MHKPISRLGFGGWQLGNHQEWGQMDEEQGFKLVQTAFENGITFFDTAPNYAAGRSEIYLGMATKLFRDKIYLNSKYGHDPDGNIGFSVAGIEPSIRGSLKRLQTTYLDSLLLHNPPMEILNGATSHFQELERLKQVGLIRAYGVSIDTAEEVEAVLKQPNVTIIELLYNIFFQSCRKLLSDIHKRGILLIIKVPLDSGWLTGKYTAKAAFEGIRHRWSQEDIQRRADLVNQLSNITKDTSLTKYAMGFLFSYPEITTIIPGIKTIEQLHDHLNHQKYVLPHDIKQQFENLYDQSIAKNPLPW